MNSIWYWIMATRTRIVTAVLVVAVLLGFVIYKLWKKLGKQKFTGKPIGTAPEGFKWVIQKYGKEYAQTLERAMRHETAHFTSGQWLATGTAGMEANPRDNEKYPFGWGSLDKFAKAHGLGPDDFFVKRFNDAHTGVPTNYIGFKQTGHFVMFMAWFLATVRKGNIYAWNSLDATKQARYKSLVDQVQIKFTA